jgi:hypothetical protein
MAGSVSDKEVVDNTDAVVMVDDAKPAESTEHDGTDKLGQSQGRVQLAEFRSCIMTLQYLIEWHAEVI